MSTDTDEEHKGLYASPTATTTTSKIVTPAHSTTVRFSSLKSKRKTPRPASPLPLYLVQPRPAHVFKQTNGPKSAVGERSSGKATVKGKQGYSLSLPATDKDYSIMIGRMPFPGFVVQVTQRQTLRGGAGAPCLFKAENGSWVFGRSQECHVSFPSEEHLSRKHARIHLNSETGEAFVEDMSTNGVAIDGVQIASKGKQKLKVGAKGQVMLLGQVDKAKQGLSFTVRVEREQPIKYSCPWSHSLLLEDPHCWVSREHCQLKYSALSGTFSVMDMGSSNGTFVRGKEIRKGSDHKLTCNSEVVIGGHHPSLACGHQEDKKTGGALYDHVFAFTLERAAPQGGEEI